MLSSESADWPIWKMCCINYLITLLMGLVLLIGAMDNSFATCWIIRLTNFEAIFNYIVHIDILQGRIIF